MKFSLRTLLYIVIAAGAIFVGLSFFDNEPQTDVAVLEAMREGDMKKLIFSAPKPMVETVFVGEDGQPMTLGAFRGQYTVLNFWATWCAPCRKEMPTLEALDKAFEGKGLDVVTIATGRNPAPAIDKFFTEIGVENLTKHLDPKQALARDMAVLGLPVTVVLDRDAREIARLTGDADWDAPEAIAILTALVESGS
ncbi:MAG: TlpA disulfide reductase family protein [Paracoccaceae bacterium]|jgi:thiol-disulfide isomerase/thioredoxin|nr:TlpA disulfide reductase family protein [Paracoccaceae bacterium]MDP7186319.1 TlpA disulfide reductase family protein [Paracoccaceae bacterium]